MQLIRSSTHVPGDLHVLVVLASAAIEVAFNSSWALSLVAHTQLLALVPRSSLKGSSAKGICVLEHTSLHIPRRIGLYSRPDAAWSPLMRDFAELLRA